MSELPRWWATELYPSKDEDNIGIAGDFEVVQVKDLPPPAVWSRERPTEEGYYWFKVPRSGPELYKVFEVGVGQLAIENSGEIFWLEKFDGEWAGPLRPPVEGKG